MAGHERVAVDVEPGVSVASSTLRNDTLIDLVQLRSDPESTLKAPPPGGVG